MGRKLISGLTSPITKKNWIADFEKLIDIWGADHHGEVARTKGALKALGYENKLEVILTQFVRVLKDGKEMKMSKRAGTYVSVDDLIDEVGMRRDEVFLSHAQRGHAYEF